MEITIYHVDAFTDTIFSGNPAAVCLLPHWLDDKILQAITYENNLPATVFLTFHANRYEIRWFTPLESALCGHGTLAAAYVIFNHLGHHENELNLHSKSGILNVKKNADYIVLNFPQKIGTAVAVDPLLKSGLNNTEIETVIQYQQERCIVVIKNQQQVQNLQPDMSILKNYSCPGIVVTAPGEKFDFVSRTFYPHKIISEDPVTGVSHCMLAPYWAQRLGKNSLQAFQLSQRGGYLKCEILDNRVLLQAKAVLYLQGQISL